MPTVDELYAKLAQATAANDATSAKQLQQWIREEELGMGQENYGSPKPTPTGQANLSLQTAAADMPPSDAYEAPAYMKSLAERGVDVSKGAPAGNLKASFSPNISSRAKVYERALTSYYGKDIKVTPDITTGKLVYKDPSGNTRLIDDQGSASAGSVAAQAGKMIPGAASLAGSMTPAPFLGGAAGAGLGEAARLGIGKAIGADESANVDTNEAGDLVPSSYRAGQIAKEGVDTAASTFISSLPMLVAIKLPGLATFFAKGVKPFKPAFAEKLLNESAQADKLVEDVNKAGAEGFNPDVAQRSNNFQALKYREAVLGDPKYNTQLVQQQQGNMSALRQGVNNASNNAGVMPGMAGNEGAQATAGQVTMEQQAAQARLEQDIDRAKGSLGKIVDEMPNTTKAQLKDALTPAIIAKTESLNETTKQAYFARNVATKNAAPIPPEYWGTPDGADWRNLVTELKSKTKTGLTDEERAAWKGALPTIPNPAETQEEALFRELGIPKGTDRSMSVEALSDHIQHLREKIRSASLGRPVAGQATPKLMELKDAAVQARAGWLRINNPQLLERVEAAEKASLAEAEFRNQMISNGFIKSVHGDTDPSVKAGVLDPIIRTGDVDAAKALRDGVANDPKAVSTLDNFALAYFKRMFKPNKAGDLNVAPSALNKAEFDTLQTLKGLMSPDSLKAVEQTFDLQKHVNIKTVQMNKAVEAFNRSFEGRISNMNGEGITSAILGAGESFGVQDTVKLKSLTQQAGTYEATKSSLIIKVRDSITGVDGSDFTPDRLNSLVNNKDTMNKLTVFVGADYTSKLKSLNDGLNMMNRTSGAAAALPSERTKFSDIARTFYAKPLTMEGRALTLLQGMRKEAFARGISEGLSSQEGLAKLVEMSRLYSDTNRYMSLASDLGASAMAGPDVYGNKGRKAKTGSEDR